MSDKIHIKPSHEGLFTAKAKRHKLTVSQFADKVLANPKRYDEATRKQAQFAYTAEHWGVRGK